MSEWKRVRLGDCCRSISDGDHLPPPKTDSGIPFVTISDIHNNRFDLSNTRFVPEAYYEAIDQKRKIQKGDVLYSVVGSYGIPVFANESLKVAFQRHIAILRPSEEIEPRFLYYSMLNRDFFLKADAVAVGAAQKTITLAALRGLEIALPPLPIQRRIAAILSDYDSAIDNARRQIALLEEAAMRLYREWFCLKSGAETSIASLGEYMNGYAFKPSDFRNEGMPILKIREMQNGVSNSTPRNSGKDIPDKYRVFPGDIVFSWSATLDVVYWSGEVALLNQHLFKVTPRNNYSVPFVYCAIKSSLETFRNLAHGATMQHIQRGKLDEVKVYCPTAEELSEYNEIAEPLYRDLMHKKALIHSLTEARDRLLPKLMSGEIEV